MKLGKSQRDKDERQVASVAVVRDGRLLWLRRRDNGKWTLPGGHLNPAEEPLDGAGRELTEETGLDPNGGQMEYLGDQEVPGHDLRVFGFYIELPEGEPTAANDPDAEAAEFQWMDELPPTEECHVPHQYNVTLKLLGLLPDSDSDMQKSEMQKEWRSKDGLRIPHHTSPSRKEWDKAYHAKLVEFFGHGDRRRLKPIRIPVSEHLDGHYAGGAERNARRNLYSRMVAGGDKLPPIIVRRNGLGWHIVDGNTRLTAALKHKLPELDAFELVDPIKKSDHDCDTDGHNWIRDAIGQYCFDCGGDRRILEYADGLL